jgi:hypothetical protein
MTASANWFHCSVKAISRSTGRSVVAAAAYRLGNRMEDHEYAEVRDFTRRGGVVTSFTVAPEHAPAWVQDPERLWNAAEAAENRRNSQVGRECELALPASLSGAEREAIVRAYAQDLVDRYGVAVTAAIHLPSRHDEAGLNHHAHILMTTRRMEAEGLGPKTRELDAKATGPGEVRWMREHAADVINAALERAGLDERVDHRSFRDRGIEREPTTHLGPAASELERREGESDRGDANREVEERNRELDALVTELAQLDAEIAAAEEQRLDAAYGPAEAEHGLADPVVSEAVEPTRPTREEKRAASDAIHETEPVADYIRQHGELPQTGLGGVTWWQRAATVITRFRDDIYEAASRTWQNMVESVRGHRDKDDGPDMTR